MNTTERPGPLYILRDLISPALNSAEYEPAVIRMMADDRRSPQRLAPPPRPRLSDPEPPEGWPDLRMTLADLIGGAVLLFGLLVGAVGLVLGTFWILSAIFELIKPVVIG